MRRRFRSALPPLALALLFPGAAAMAESGPPELLPIAGPLALDGSFGFTSWKKSKKQTEHVAEQRRSVSGVACAGERCMIVFDEGRSARFVTLSDKVFQAMPGALELRANNPKEELDTEGAAIGGDKLYVTGSHAKARKVLEPQDELYPETTPDADGLRCKAHPDAVGLFRLALDGAGLPAADAKAQEPTGPGLMDALKGTALETALNQCLKLGKGLNIEGLAFKDEKLFFGLRGPKPSSEFAYVVAAPAESLFGATTPQVEILKLPVSVGLAIRDMLAVKDGFLVLIGPDDIPENAGKAFSLVHWSGANAAGAVELGRIPTKVEVRPKSDNCEDDVAKPEALSATETQDGWKVVVLSDGLCDGGPLWFDVKRP